jgi:hypothetical protein
MAFFRSPILRRVIYAVALGLALMRFAATRSHSEPLVLGDPLPKGAVEHLLML